jgi:hypothetical protein
MVNPIRGGKAHGDALVGPTKKAHVSTRTRGPGGRTRLMGWAVVGNFIAQTGGRDYSLVGAANLADEGKLRDIGHFRQWAPIIAIILAAFAVLSWPNQLFVTIFLGGAILFAAIASVLYLPRHPRKPD